jgi:hypothetical protein
MIQVTSVKAISGFRLVLTFNTGERRCFDMRPYLHYPVFRRLENPAFFGLARVDYGTVRRSMSAPYQRTPPRGLKTSSVGSGRFLCTLTAKDAESRPRPSHYRMLMSGQMRPEAKHPG